MQDIKASKKEGAVHKDSFKPKIQVETQPKAVSNRFFHLLRFIAIKF